MFRKFAVCGLGNRAQKAYMPALLNARKNGEQVEIVAIIDHSIEAIKKFKEVFSLALKGYLAEDFEKMLFETNPDIIIICSPDHAHFNQILTVLKHDKIAFVEKPMAITSCQSKMIMEVEERSAGKVIVAHNLRYLNLNQNIKEILDSNTIGCPIHVHFSYHLLPAHGASYFRRWHRHKISSGGMWITKSCHHFDLLNWWLNDVPYNVFAISKRNHFKCGLTISGNPPTTIPMDSELDDTLSAVIQYRKGAIAYYSLNASSVFEGFRFSIEGVNGFLNVEYDRYKHNNYSIHLKKFSSEEEIRIIPRELGSHSGADDCMLSQLIFGSGIEGFPDSEAGANAISIGEAINRSSQSGKKQFVVPYP